MRADRKGYTLIELLVVSVLGALVLGAILQVLIVNQRTYTTQSAVIQGQQASRMGLEVLFNELREVSPSGGDILAMSSDSIKVRLMRKFGIACELDLAPASGSPRLRVLANSGPDFADGDSVFVFAENREATGNDDVWIPAEVTGVDDSVDCLGQDALDLEFDGQAALFVPDTVRVGAAVRSFEPFTFRRDNWNGNMYLTRRSGTDMFPWPIAGPIRPTGGLEFIYRDALGNVTGTPANVRQIEVRIRTNSPVINTVGNQVTDSLDTWIYTRN